MKWPSWMRRKLHRPAKHYLHHYEETVILSKLREQGWESFSVRDLHHAYPGVFHERYVRGALKRMVRRGYITQRRVSQFGGPRYKVSIDINNALSGREAA